MLPMNTVVLLSPPPVVGCGEDEVFVVDMPSYYREKLCGVFMWREILGQGIAAARNTRLARAVIRAKRPGHMDTTGSNACNTFPDFST